MAEYEFDNADMEQFSLESLGGQISICISPEHRFGTDAFLLADFAAVGMHREDRVCDLGTGCGIIPLLLCRKQPPRRIYAVDIQRQAIEQLAQSVQHSGLHEVITPVLADLRVLPEDIPRGLELVTCNPPYYLAGTGAQSETEAERIARHEVMCTVEDVCRAGFQLLKYGGRLCICQRPERLCDVICAMRKYGIEPKRLRFVAKHANTEPWLFLIEGKRGAKPFLRVLPQMIVQGEGGFSRELLDIYGFKSNLPGKESKLDSCNLPLKADIPEGKG